MVWATLISSFEAVHAQGDFLPRPENERRLENRKEGGYKLDCGE